MIKLLYENYRPAKTALGTLFILQIPDHALVQHRSSNTHHSRLSTVMTPIIRLRLGGNICVVPILHLSLAKSNRLRLYAS